MAQINILKTDARGRITLPAPFRNEPLFEYAIEGNQITLYPVLTVRKFPAMDDAPYEELSPAEEEGEKRVNADTRKSIRAKTPSQALKKLRK